MFALCSEMTNLDRHVGGRGTVVRSYPGNQVGSAVDARIIFTISSDTASDDMTEPIENVECSLDWMTDHFPLCVSVGRMI